MGISLSHARYEKIKQIIVDLFVQYVIRCIPVSAFEVATKMGVPVIPYSAIPENKRHLLYKESEDGFVVEKAVGEWYIYYNDQKEYGRINNTIMHEIGHIVLNHSEDSELAEKEVKFFAKYALAPPVLIHKLGLKNAIEVYEHFDVSIEAAGYAYQYYRKWLAFGGNDYTDYELRLLRLFDEAV